MKPENNKNFNIAISNLRTLSKDPYPGRGLFIGLNDTGEELIAGYFIGGRSEGSQLRMLKEVDDTTIRTRAIKKVEKNGETYYIEKPDEEVDPVQRPLIIYNAMKYVEANGNKILLVTNGDQTDAIHNAIISPENKHYYNAYLSVKNSLLDENDAPNFTSRIVGITDLNNLKAFTSIIKKEDSGETKRLIYDPFIMRSGNKDEAGYAICFHTYENFGRSPADVQDKEKRLPPFKRVPYLIRIEGSAQDILNKFSKEVLNPETYAAMVVQSYKIKTGERTVLTHNKREIRDSISTL